MKDLLALTDYISNRFDKKKIILMGHSFGTYIATQAAHQAPEKYEAYIGIGQTADTVESVLEALNYLIDQAKSSGNTTDAKYLQGLTDKIQSGEQFAPRKYLQKYGGAARLIDFEEWFFVRTGVQLTKYHPFLSRFILLSGYFI
ncbi:alpha/beta fold hydrolase [Paenibacillus sp. NPDC057934]|uniref:alpha/beta hydrolase n=1 Tax=Paenibacillus sp. NPDC057934 TaxID=3346282 RepID=UPI0036D9261D